VNNAQFLESAVARQPYIRQGECAVRPYLYGPLALAGFLKDVFDAEEIERTPMGENAFHIEARIGDSIVLLELKDPPYDHATRASTYVYVRDVDDTFRRAAAAGAEVRQEPKHQIYEERNAGVRDAHGNIWWFGTYTGKLEE
jgi:uncharacterized glyoxalase superfamily protein PhnB